MGTVIRQIVLRRFRSISEARITFDNPTIFVGRNGSGKSNLVSAFSFLAEAMGSPLQAVFDRAGGIEAVRNRRAGRSHPPKLGMRVEFDRLNGGSQRGFYAFEIKAKRDYGFSVVREQCVLYGSSDADRVWFDRRDTKFSSSLRGLNPSIDEASLSLPVIGGEKSFSPVLRTFSNMRVYAIEPGKLREMQEPDSGLILKPNGANVASVIKEIKRRSPEDFKRLSEFLAAIVPNTNQVAVKRHGKSLSLKFTQQWGEGKSERINFEGFSMSDGTLRALGLLASVFQQPSPSLIVVEEPEATIHPGALDAIFELLLEASERMQVVMTTHSPELLDVEGITDRHLRMVEWSEGATRVASVSDANRKALQKHLMGAGELLRTNALEPAPLFNENPDQIDLFEDFQ